MKTTAIDDDKIQKTKLIAFRMTPAEHALIAKEAKRRGVSMSKLLRGLIQFERIFDYEAK